MRVSSSSGLLLDHTEEVRELREKRRKTNDEIHSMEMEKQAIQQVHFAFRRRGEGAGKRLAV
jgi:hypothetical protein